MNDADLGTVGQERVLARFLARKLTAEELEMVSGGGCGDSGSSCSGSDHSTCDLDNCDLHS